MFGSLFRKKGKVPPYSDLARANLYAADQITQATDRTIEEFLDYLGIADDAYRPWIALGESAMADIEEGLRTGAFDAGEFQAPTVSSLTADPDYTFRLQEGLRAVNQQYAARGLGLSGEASQAAQELAQNLAASTYEDMYGRAVQQWDMEQARRGARFQRLGGVAEMGLNAQADRLGGRRWAASGMGQARLLGAQARGAGRIGYWNAMIERRKAKNQQQGGGLLGSVFGTLGTIGGAALGGYLGGPAGAAIGGRVGGTLGD